MLLRLIVAAVVVFVVLVERGHLYADGPLVKNGDFEQWKDEMPEGWQVEVAARNGADVPQSAVRKIMGPAIAISGDAKTMAWRAVSQELVVDPNKTYRLTFQARSKGVKREGRQFDNSYVGFMSMNGADKVVGRSVKDVSSNVDDWTTSEIIYKVPADATKTSITIFLSKSGLIAVRGIAVEAVEMKQAIDAEPKASDLLANGGFSQWTNGFPENWNAEVGAKNGADQPASTIQQLDQAGVELSGNAATMAWQTLSQDVKLSEGKNYTLTFQASAEAIQRQGRQFDNCYVGVMHFDNAGKRLDMKMEDLSKAQNFKEHSIRVSVPVGTKKSSVVVFLSKSGTLKIKNLRLEEATGKQPFRGTR